MKKIKTYTATQNGKTAWSGLDVLSNLGIEYRILKQSAPFTTKGGLYETNPKTQQMIDIEVEVGDDVNFPNLTLHGDSADTYLLDQTTAKLIS